MKFDNTYKQDVQIPIYITLTYGVNSLKLPVNPEQIKKIIPSNSITANIEGIGEVSIPQTPSLAEITLESFIWQQYISVPSFFYVEWLERWQKSKKPALLVVTRFNYSMLVTCEGFTHWINGGEEEDIYYELQLKEYRPYGAKKLNVKKTLLSSVTSLVSSIKEGADNLISNVPAVLYEIPRKSRDVSSKQAISNPYTTKKHDTLLTIAKKITGDSEKWKELYNENKTELDDSIMNKDEIPIGTKLNLPIEWVNNTSYNIVSIE